jgi:hypothetical protein
MVNYVFRRAIALEIWIVRVGYERVILSGFQIDPR